MQDIFEFTMTINYRTNGKLSLWFDITALRYSCEKLDIKEMIVMIDAHYKTNQIPSEYLCQNTVVLRGAHSQMSEF